MQVKTVAFTHASRKKTLVVTTALVVILDINAADIGTALLKMVNVVAMEQAAKKGFVVSFSTGYEVAAKT